MVLTEPASKRDPGFTGSDQVIEYLKRIHARMAWPGQALGYKIGELTILDLRAKAEQRLGKRFDLRAFHDAILEEGHLPLDMLKQRIDAWIGAEDRKRSL